MVGDGSVCPPLVSATKGCRKVLNRLHQALYLLILLTFWGIFILIVPDHQQLGQTRHLGHLSDDPEEALHTVVGEDDGSEALRLWWDQREEERVAHTSPLLQKDRRWGSEKELQQYEQELNTVTGVPSTHLTAMKWVRTPELRWHFHTADLKHTSTSTSPLPNY